MKWDTLRFVGANNVDFPIVGVDASGPFILKGVEGLDPPPVDALFTKVRGQRGVRQQREPQQRQIVALVGLQPDWTIGQSSSDLRETLYGLLTPKYDVMAKAQVRLGSTTIAEAQGDISNIDASIFSKDPEVQITMDCDYGYLTAPLPITQVPARTTNAGITSLVIENDGTAPAGFFMSIKFTSSHSGTLQIMDGALLGGKILNVAGPFVANDVLSVDTRPGSRGVWLAPAGNPIASSILSRMSGTWLTLHGGDNIIRVNNVGFEWGISSFTHLPSYWGV